MGISDELNNLKDKLKWVNHNLDDAMKAYQRKDYPMANSCVCTASAMLDQAIEKHFKESK